MRSPNLDGKGVYRILYPNTFTLIRLLLIDFNHANFSAIKLVPMIGCHMTMKADNLYELLMIIIHEERSKEIQF